MNVKIVNSKGRKLDNRNCMVARKHITSFEVAVRADRPISEEQVRTALERLAEVTGVRFIARVVVA